MARKALGRETRETETCDSGRRAGVLEKRNSNE
jgi:hypothetical protein